MKESGKRIFAGCAGIALIYALLFIPGFPGSARCRYFVNKLRAKAEMKVSAWQGVTPGLISLSGRVVGGNGVLRGAEVEVLDSISGWASLSDEQGKFVVRDLMWYPEATYRVLVKPNDYQVRELKVVAPSAYPDGGILNVGDLRFDRLCKIDATELRGRNSVSHIDYDGHNLDYYKELFAELTAGKQTDEEKVDALSRYVASRLIPGEGGREVEPALYIGPESPRDILEKGTRYCGELASALATLAEAGNYKTRMVDLIDAASRPSAHMVTEIYYGERWHLYDPIIGAVSRSEGSGIASYKELRLDTAFRLPAAVPEHLPKIFGHPKDRMAEIYRSGSYHYYYLRRRT